MDNRPFKNIYINRKKQKQNLKNLLKFQFDGFNKLGTY